jgi:MerR family transcriptional regulator, light-induced transcriptional regulator
MGHYSIRDLERLTGVKAHTIRIWEQRYQLLHPERSDTNIRNYCDHNLKKLISIAILNKNGFRISKIAGMSDEEIASELMLTIEADNDSRIDNLVLAMIEMNEQRFEKILNHSILQQGLEESLIHVVYPFFRKVGLLWLTGSIIPAQEHFISNLIRQKIIVAIDGLDNQPKTDAPGFLLFLPEWEMHEIGLLFYTYLIKKRGFPVIYLGQVVPFEDVKAVYQLKKPSYLLSIFTTGEFSEQIQLYINKLGESFESSRVFINGLQMHEGSFNLPPNISLIRDPMDFRRQLDLL